MRTARTSTILAALALVLPVGGLSGQFTLFERGETSLDIGGYVRSLTQLYDPGYEWTARSTADRWEVGRIPRGVEAFPYFFYISTVHMRVWDTFTGWADDSIWEPAMAGEMEILDFCAEASGTR